MAYYNSGDYYRGDPGIFDFLKKVGSGVVGAATGFLTGGPLGAVKGAVTAVARTDLRTAITAPSSSAYTPAMAAKHATLVARGSTGITRGGLAMQGGAPGMALQLAAGVHGIRRMHYNKSTYVTRGGGTSRWPVGLAVHPKGTEPVPSRRMNVTNPRALRRALRRAAGFGKIVRRMKRALARASSAVGNVHRGRARAAPRRR